MEEEYLLTCLDCGEKFFTEGEKKFYKSRKLEMPKRCKKCRTIRRAKWEQEQRVLEGKKFDEALKESKLTVKELSEIHLTADDAPLYIIGNGFDMAHGVKSSYKDFRDSMNRYDNLRQTLEMYINDDSLWSNFEEALAKLDTSLMTAALPELIRANGAFEDDALAADYYLSIEMAMEPADTITNELPRKFRKWVDSLKLLSNEKILGDLIIENAKYLNFNYTEFIENLYGAKGVCYIHGSRKQKQNKLVLGHSHETEIPSPDLSIIKNRNDRMIGKYALTNAEEHLVWYEEANTKRSPDIIKKYQNFFNSLQDIKTIVIIGHSLSSVDMDYYKEVVSKNRDSENLKWIISCHDIDGLDAVKEFNAFWRIPPEREIIFKL